MEKCVACQFYDRGHQPQADQRGIQWGQCRRSAPHLHPVNQKSFMIEGVWPHVRDDDWCGEWKGARSMERRHAGDAVGSSPLMPAVANPFSRPAASGVAQASVSNLNANGATTPSMASAFGSKRASGQGD